MVSLVLRSSLPWGRSPHPWPKAFLGHRFFRGHRFFLSRSAGGGYRFFRGCSLGRGQESIVIGTLVLGLGAIAPAHAQNPSTPGFVFDEPAVTSALQQEIEQLNHRGVASFAMALQGNLAEWRTVQQDIQQVQTLVTATQSLVQQGALGAVPTAQGQALTTALQRVQQHLQNLQQRWGYLGQFFTDPATFNATLIQQGSPPPDPDRWVDPAMAQSIAKDVVAAVQAYNKIILESDPATVAQLEKNAAFVGLGQNIRLLGVSLVNWVDNKALAASSAPTSGAVRLAP